MAQSFAKQLYASKAWMDLRLNLIIERGPKCQECGSVATDTSRLIGHHTVRLTPQNITDPQIALNHKLVKLLCHDCHNKEPGHFHGSKSRNVYLVYGAPCSGKTTIVTHMAERGDIVLDIDKLFEAISLQPIYDKPDNLRFNIFALRDKMLDMIKTRFGQWHDAFVIGGYPIKAERERIATELGAELIYCERTREQCYAAMHARQMPESYRKFIDKWFAEYTA